MEQKRILRIVVASPGDVQAERGVMPAVFDELNRGIAAERDLLLELSRWETDAYPGFHSEGPQGLIDPILKVEDCDVLIGIFWKRFGTPTTKAKSGTEHEILNAYRGWQQNGRPQIMIYFSQQAHTPQSKVETDQWGQVLDFKRNFPSEGLWWEYRGKAEFERLLRNHLTQFIRNEFPRVPPATTGTRVEPNRTDGGGQGSVSVNEGEAGGGDADSVTQEQPASKKRLYATLAGLITAIVLGGAIAYRMYGGERAKPPLDLGEITNREFDDEFLNLNKWTPPPTGWSIDPNDGEGRLVIEKQPQVGCAAGVVYGDFELRFHLKLLNDGGAAWALRADKSGGNYYLFYLSGPTGLYRRERFVTYIVRNGVIDKTTEGTNEIDMVELKEGTQYRVVVKAVGNKIEHVLEPAQTGVPITLREFLDPTNTLPRGRICFRTVGDEKFSVDDLFVDPLNAQPTQ